MCIYIYIVLLETRCVREHRARTHSLEYPRSRIRRECADTERTDTAPQIDPPLSGSLAQAARRSGELTGGSDSRGSTRRRSARPERKRLRRQSTRDALDKTAARAGGSISQPQDSRGIFPTSFLEGCKDALVAHKRKGCITVTA